MRKYFYKIKGKRKFKKIQACLKYHLMDRINFRDALLQTYLSCLLQGYITYSRSGPSLSSMFFKG